MCDVGVSTLNVEITCGLRLSEIWKSSFFSPVTTFPCASRTTARTNTRLTRTLKVAGVSRLVTSEALLALLASGETVCFGADSGFAGVAC